MKKLLPPIMLALAIPILLATMNEANAQNTTPQAGSTIRVTPAQEPRPAPAEYFIGSVKLAGAFQTEAPARVGGATVTFSAGARTHWHTHPLGQTLVVTEGQGRVQEWGGAMREIHKGDVVWIPPGVKHWHGAAPTSGMTHVAISERLNGKSVDWLEKVTDDQYGLQGKTQEPTVAQKNYGDFSPKFVELTDNVLFGDVWERPEMSKRDRSLVVVSALIANGNTEQLRGHLQRAMDNGVTETELKEAIIQLAFYTGWPRAVSAINVAKEVFNKP